MKYKFSTYSPKRAAKEIKFLPFNRESRARKDLISSLNENGALSAITCATTDVVMGKKETYVLDGQNRLKSMLYLEKEIPVFFVEREIVDAPDLVNRVAVLNSTQKSWKTDDFVHAHASLNYKNYKEVISLKDKYAYSYALICSLVHSNIGKCPSAQRAVKGGDLQIRYKSEATTTLDLCKRLTQIKKPSVKMAYGIHQIRKSDSYDEDIFIQKYADNVDMLFDFAMDDYYLIFSDWF